MITSLKALALAAAIPFLAVSTACAQSANSIRARDIGIPFTGETGPLNAITDVPGVTVGHVTLAEGEARTGATAIFPRGSDAIEGVAAATFTFNGTGEMTGTHLIDEYGAFFGPVVLTGTLGVGTARDAVSIWTASRFSDPIVRYSRLLPVVAETFDGFLNDVWSLPLQTENVIEALETASAGPVKEGSVGGGTGMICYQFKCGIGTASRIVRVDEETAFTVGVLVQANHGRRDQLTIAGVQVGQQIPDLKPHREAVLPEDARDGSIIIVIATDSPLLPGQLSRLAKRATIGLARTGGQGDTGSGDIFLAFTTANPFILGGGTPINYTSIPNEQLDPLFDAVIQATEEAILNAMVAADDMSGHEGSKVHAMPHDRMQTILRKSGIPSKE